MNRLFQKHPYLFSVLAGLICLILVACGSAASQILAMRDTPARLTMAGGCFVSALVGLALMRRSGLTWAELGFRSCAPHTLRGVWYFLPLLLLELLPLFLFGLPLDRGAPALLLFVLAVGVNEEIYFRGLILRCLRQKGVYIAIFGSSLLFGLLHAGNLLGGADPFYTVLQVVFAALVGLTLSCLVSLTGSLWLPILWHAAHDFISIQTDGVFDTRALTLACVQTVILLIYGIFLWRKVKKQA